MPYDESLAKRVRAALIYRQDLEEKHMFGGIAFMVRGHMACGLVGDALMVRVDAADHDALVAEPHARTMDFTGRPMRGFLLVDPAGTKTAATLKKWINRAVTFVETQPVKTRNVADIRARAAAMKPSRATSSPAGKAMAKKSTRAR